MQALLIAVSILLAGGAASLALTRNSRLSSTVGCFASILGGVIGLSSAINTLCTGADSLAYAGWSLPFGQFEVGVDQLSAVFLIPVFGITALAAVYGMGYMRQYEGRRALGPHWFFFNLLTAGMAMVVMARDGLLFLIAWEVMSIAPFFLVTFDDEKEGVRSAGWTYLVAAHLGAVPLLVLFIMLGQYSGSMGFTALKLGAVNPEIAGILFLLALIGFGTKAGLAPLHVWLPEAHPAAPSHVSAVMSGVMIKMGIYGIFRFLSFFASFPAWWGYTLIGVGLVTALVGVIFAVAQSDLKRMLAYSSIENIGIIVLGMGMGVMGLSLDSPVIAAAGFGGALLHVINHSIFKTLLFMGAGAVLHGSGTAELGRLGGLIKKMPKAAVAFSVGCAAVCGLPPFNGFAGEFMIYLAGITGGGSTLQDASAVSWLAVSGLALVGGLAAVAFVKAFGGAFLGEPRDLTIAAHEPDMLMRGTMAALAAACLLMGLLSPVLASALSGAISQTTGMPLGIADTALSGAVLPLWYISLISTLFVVFAGVLILLRRKVLAGRTVGEAGTWDCGYVKPANRMQYTPSSLVQPLTLLFAPLLRTKSHLVAPQGFFPKAASYEATLTGVTKEYIYRPVFMAVASGMSRFRWLQHGRINIYVLYIAITLVALVMWKL